MKVNVKLEPGEEKFIEVQRVDSKCGLKFSYTYSIS